ncbi:MAG: DHHW family protein [Clostridium sp.]|uniref:DHHW family protein n=1 Tax=Clostridium sp. TaxID=1506 RepID=UPI002FC6FDE0
MIKYTKYAILTVLFLIVIFPLAIYDGFKADREYSEIENRGLRQMPKLGLDGVLSGEFFTEYEEYRKDQYIFKDDIVGSYLKLNFYVLNRDKINGFYLGDNGRLYEDEKLETDKLEEFVKKKNEFIISLNASLEGMGVKMYNMYAPISSDYNMNNLPEYAKYNMKRVFEFEKQIDSVSSKVDYINARELFKDDLTGDKYYYKTDHHWNIDGAYKAYEYIVNKAKKDFQGIEDQLEPYNGLMVDTYYEFNGSYNRQLQFNVSNKEDFKVYRPSKDLITERITGEKIGQDIIDKSLIESPSTYSTFMGGDMPKDIVKTGRSNLPNVLVIGNSFTNSLETLLYANFNEMHSIDVRESNLERVDIPAYVKKHNINLVVYIHGGIK